MKNLYKMLTVAVTFVAGISAYAQNLNVTFQANLPISNQSCANICGYVDSFGNEYALVGAAQGMWIVNVTNPVAPVTVSQIPNVNNLWKEIKVYQNYAYVTTEGGGGLQIVDLGSLPAAPTTYHNYTGDGAIAGLLDNIHALHIDTTLGFCYLYGSNLFNGGAVVLDLNTDPYNPTYVGNYENPANAYVHDGYVDNDTLYAGHIYAGVFCVVDMTNKANPVVLATQNTTTNFTHNTWPSNDKKFLFTTDENTNSFLTAYNISDLNNIETLDKTQSQFPNSGSIGHNTHILDNWAVTSWYRDGFVITDVTRPMNLINVGWYDNFAGTGNGFNGDWGVYPYLPSGTVVLSNMEDGLWVFAPNYVRACYLEGTIKDSICGTPLSGVNVTISTVNVTDVSDINGEVRTGTAIPGTYNVTFSKPGYVTYTMNNVVFAAGVLDTFNIRMYSANAVNLTGTTSHAISTNDIPGVQVMFSNANNTYNFVSDANGDFSNCSVISGDYEIAAAAWGYNGICTTDSIHPGNSIQNFQLTPGYADDFTFDLGWTVTTTATSGAWERGEPIGTDYNGTGDSNPDFDSNNDCFDQAYVTGNAGGSASQDDVDGGSTTLTSPVMDLTIYFDPWIHYERWFFNDGGSGSPNDSLVIRLTDGTTTKTLEKVLATNATNSSWVPKNYRVLDYFTPTANMQLIVTTADNFPGHLVEAGFDAFNVADSSLLAITNPVMSNGISVYPNPFDGTTTVQYALDEMPGNSAFIQVKDISGRVIATQNVTAQSGTILLGQDLAAGIYFVRIMDGTSYSQAVRLVKTK